MGLLGLAGIVGILLAQDNAQDFEVVPIFNSDDSLAVSFQADQEHYYILETGGTLNDFEIIEMALFRIPEARMNDDAPGGGPRRFARVTRVSVDEPRDTDRDGIDDVYELENWFILNPLDPTDAGEMPFGDGRTNLEEYQNPIVTLTSIESSPSHGESGVALTRETFLTFSNRLSPAAAEAIDETNFFAKFGGSNLDARIHVSPDRQTATLFYDDPLPPNSIIQVHFKTDGLTDRFGQIIDGDGDGAAGGDFMAEFTTLGISAIAGTAICGRVFASELVESMGSSEFVNAPLESVKITVDGAEDTLFTFTDQFGNFRLEPAPIGEFFVHIDGKQAVNTPPGGYYPNVGKAWVGEANVELNIGDVYLPLIADGTLQTVSQLENTSVQLPQAVVDQRPELAEVELIVPADSLFANDGARGGSVGVAPVDPDRLPGQLPDGLEFPVVITVQTDGATNFDEPVPVCFPNLPDPVTGETLPPGAKSALWSFNHDTGRFEVVGPMTVSADGTKVCTDPGVGILAPGWHGVQNACPGGGPPPGPCTPNPCPCRDCEDEKKRNPSHVGDPIDPATGEVYHEETDLVIKGRGMDFEWKRRYASRNGRLTPMGQNWDFSYNQCVRPSGRIVKLDTGSDEVEELQLNADGVYERREMFQTLTKNVDESWTLLRADQQRVSYRATDETMAPGQVESISDRNGNTMMFSYNAEGQLTTITDTLGRDISVAYNADGFVESVTDFTGRQVLYEYYQNGDADGGFGDLKSVTRPAVTGTPHGNDFPAGKTTTYTYTTGFADDRLNHNLVSITDGRRNDPNDPTFGDGPFATNVYSSSTDPGDLNFDRAIRQIWGGDVIDISYQELQPDNPGVDPVELAIINDRNGNVCEQYFDAGNRLLAERKYTGRAADDEPTTLTENRPVGQLRPGDPPFFETRWEFNSDSKLVRKVDPNGNETINVYEEDLDPMADPRFRGNLRQVIRRAGPLGGDQIELVESFEYENNFGCTASCGFNFVTRHTDARGNVTLRDYDASGNLAQVTHRIASIVENFEYNQFGQLTAHIHPDNGSGHRRRDEFTYYGAGSQRGYRESAIIDSTGFALTTGYEYDVLGRTVRQIDGRGNDRLFVYNQLDQVVQEFSEEVAPGGGLRYEKRTFYDANNNVIQEDVQNVDADGVLNANAFFTTTYQYEFLDHVIEKSEEVEAGRNIVTQFQYDKNRNQTKILFGEATAGRQLANTVAISYDERDLMFRQTRAEGTAIQSTAQFDYDGNQNQIAMRHGLEDQPRVTTTIFDGYDRLKTQTDPMGNVTSYVYDENGNIASSRVDGEVDDTPGAAGNVRLEEVAFQYDNLDRQTLESRSFFNTATQADILDGASATTTVWSDFSRVLQVTNDNNNSSSVVYDTANRPVTSTDAKGNTVTRSYDGNSNLVSILEVEKSDLAAADQSFTTTLAYDGLNRRITTTDNVGNVSTSFYDSRNNLARTLDALGNRIDHDFDGLNRNTQTTRFLTDTGTGAGAVTDTIVTQQIWDDSSRLVGQRDDNGNLTSYEYDGLNRKTATQYADGTRWTCSYDVHGNDIQCVDANGSVVASQYDLNNRNIRKDITVGAGVSNDTTFEVYKYDGLNRLAHAEDDDSVVTRSYDSLSNVLTDVQNGVTVACSYDGVGNETQLTYPSGRVVTTSYDALERKNQISDGGGLIADYSYIGPDRVERCAHGNGTQADYVYDGVTGSPNPAGDFGVKRPVRITHSNPGAATVISDFEIHWDRVGNKTLRNEVTAPGNHHTEQFTYDSAYRLIQSDRTTGAGAPVSHSYQLDGVQNRVSTTGGPDAGAYVMNPADPPLDRPVNQYTSTPFDERTYDSNGNLTSKSQAALPTHGFAFDYKNRLVSTTQHSSGAITSYDYDALSRRIQKQHSSPAQTTSYIYDESSVIEERVGAQTRTYVLGAEVDKLVGFSEGASSYYYHQDDLNSVVALSGATGSLVEFYRYKDFGVPEFRGPAGTVISESDLGNDYLFTGRRYDDETELYFYRSRYLSSTLGQFLSRDELGMWTDPYNLGNASAYVGSNPTSRIDPFGHNTWVISQSAMSFMGNTPLNEKGFWGAFKGHGKAFGTAIATNINTLEECAFNIDCSFKTFGAGATIDIQGGVTLCSNDAKCGSSLSVDGYVVTAFAGAGGGGALSLNFGGGCGGYTGGFGATGGAGIGFGYCKGTKLWCKGTKCPCK